MTHRKAKVLIENRTGKTLLSVSVGHKYSDDHKNTHDWKGPIKNGASTNPDMVVDYHTGAFTTGKDWWVVSYVTDDATMFVTDPANLRGAFDFMEKVGSQVALPLASFAAALAVTPEPVLSKGAAAAIGVTSALIVGLTNTESTKGFKQHILRSEDAGTPTKIILRADEVEFKSPSGSSTTGLTARQPEPVST